MVAAAMLLLPTLPQKRREDEESPAEGMESEARREGQMVAPRGEPGD